MKFTDTQIEAIRWPPGNLQLIACAGSGKTEVVVQRVAALLKSGAATGLAPRNIVAFTFTQKAAAELKDRIVTRVADRRAILLRIQDPAGTAKNFAFDRGWRLVAKFTEGDSEAGASPEGRG